MKRLNLVLITAFLLSSCATILNNRYQDVNIKTDSKNEILINGEKVNTKNGKYILKRDGKAKEITAKREGFKDEHITIMQFKRPTVYIISWIPFLAATPLIPLLDDGVKSRNYEKEIIIGENMIKLPVKDINLKAIKINNFKIDLKADSIKYRYFSNYKSFKNNKDKKAVINEKKENIQIENSIYSELLNDILKGKGYIDTTNNALKDSYSSNLSIDAAITDITVHYIGNFFNINNSYRGMIYIELGVKWQVLDYYKIPVFLLKTKTKSGQFAVLNPEKDAYKAAKDALEFGLIEFMNSKDVVDLMHDKSQNNTEQLFEEIEIPKSTNYVSSLSEAIQSSVTIKNKNGHGSGFIISNDGFIISNYHVISDTNDLKVIIGDSNYKVEIIRVSKIHDLALLKIHANGFTPFKISESNNIEIASEIYAIGTPTAEDLSQTISKGIISAVRKTNENSKLIQTDASVNAGNSGGAITNKDGLVLGVVSSKLKGFGIEGVAFGIPGYEIISKLKLSIK
ncbi:MAG: trypsin-like peptidase domain-containing protein [Bacteroidetes bacterium]|nr:trypsin-like peptidase domain-containing protein [Bacteroidota bacterium]